MSFDLSKLNELLVNPAPCHGVSFAQKSLKLDTEQDALEVVQAIRTCQVLEYLNLEGNTLGPVAAKAVAEALKEKGALLKRALWKDMFTGRLKTEIPKALEYLGSALCAAGTRLVELDLSDNAFGPIGVQGLAQFLTSSTCYTLQELRLNNNGLGITGGKMLAKALLECHENSSKAGTPPLSLKVFVAGRNRLENEGAEALAAVFRTLTTLEEVSMPQNSIFHPGIAALANGLSTNSGLRVLNLNDNIVGVAGAEALAKVLPKFRNLENLNLGDCLLKTKGSIILAEALGIEGNHPSLAVLNLSFNEISARGANPIAVAMADKQLLHTLQLNGNAFGAKGRAVLRTCLTDCEKINSLSNLSDDETDFSYDEEDGEDEDGEEEEDETETESEENEDEVAIENGNKTPDKSKALVKVTVAEFLKAPTGRKLLLLESDDVQNFVDHAKNLTKDVETSPELKFAEEYTRIVMKVSQLCDSGYSDVKLKANSMTDALYSKFCSFAGQNNQVSVWNNVLLVNLGLIKSEDKRSGRIDWNLEGCFKALEKVCQRQYFPVQTRNTLKFFLEKPVKITRANFIDPFQESKDSLRAALERCAT